MWGVSLTYPVLVSFLCGEFLLHIPCWLLFYLGSFSYTSLHPLLFLIIYISYTSSSFFFSLSFFSVEFFLHISCWFHSSLGSFSYTSRAGFIFLWGVSLSHPVLASFLSGEFLLHIPCFFYIFIVLFYFYIWVISLTHPVAGFFLSFFLFYLLSGEFLLHIPCWLLLFVFYVGRFSGMQSSLKTTPEEKSCVGDGPEFCC